MLTFTEAAERLVKDKIAQSMTAEGLRRLARDPLSGWPIGPGDYRMAGKVRMLPYELLAPYMRERLEKRRGRGPDTKKRSPKLKQQGAHMSTTVDPRTAVLSAMAYPPYNSTAESHCTPWNDAEKLLNAFRAAVLREAAAAVAQLIDDGEHDPDCLVDEIRRMAREQPQGEEV